MPQQKVNGIDLYYEVHGRGAPLLFIHGLGSSTRDWQPQTAWFTRHYQVILVDVRGHGQSSRPPGPYSIPQFAKDLALLLNELAVGPVTIVGLSLGGMIAFQLAVDYPELVHRLVVVNAGPEFLLDTFKKRLQIGLRFFILRVFGMRRWGEMLGKRLFIQPEQEQLRQIFTEHWAENDRRAYRDSMQAITGWSVLDQIGRISCPTLILASDEDYTSVAEKQTWVNRLSKGKLVVISDARHALPVERPEAFNRALDDFLSDRTDSEQAG